MSFLMDEVKRLLYALTFNYTLFTLRNVKAGLNMLIRCIRNVRALSHPVNIHL